MHRPALARRYRPRQFSRIVGQHHVSRTLRIAVERGRVAHAYLFCGPRGVGKTTAARVLAMALNCTDRRDGEPCGECESCQRIWSGRTSLDVVEIDAASNRGVDDARDLRERAMYAPSEESRYKVYIIDEAHMLTREAWNAFLKILEEPPPRVIFVLATTEPGKILQSAPPILSRCQRFDFHRIPIDRIVERLTEVLEAEGVEAEEGALIAIARKAEGALRDALSAADQVLAFSEDRIEAADVRQVLGLVDEDLYFELFELVCEGRAADVFGYVERLVSGGYDLEEFYKGLGDSLRTLMKVRLGGTEDGDLVTRDQAERYEEIAERLAPGDILRMLSTLAELDTDGRFKKSDQQRLLIEVTLLKFAMLDRTVELEDLLRSVEDTGSTANPGDISNRGSAGTAGSSAGEEPGSGVGTADDEEPGPPSKGSEGDDDGRRAARAAWLGMISDGKVLRPGHGIALRAARILGFGNEGELRVAVGAGTPAAELLEDQVVRRRVEKELSRRLGRPIVLQSETDGESSRPVDEQTNRRRRLDQLVEEDPDLGVAVEKLDLELMD